MSKKKRRKISRKGCDCHHLLYQRRYWGSGYARLLRELPFFKVYIPIATLHADIHKALFEIPAPSDKVCKSAFLKVVEFLDQNPDYKDMHIEERLDLLIDILGEKSPATTEALKVEREIIASFYSP